MSDSVAKKRGRNSTRLAEQNPFSFDEKVDFTEIGHVYRILGKPAEMSVTSLLKTAFPASADFDGPAIASTCLRRWRENASSRYHDVVSGIENDQDAVAAVLQIWDRNRDLGTLAHKAVELALNDQLERNDALFADVKSELDQFMQFHETQTLAGWKALRTELSLYHTRKDGTTIAGQIDVLYIDTKGQFRVVDLKRSDKDLTSRASNFGKFGTGVASALKDTYHQRYSLQCWIYSYMLKNLTGKKIGAPLLVQVHPAQRGPQVIHTTYMEDVAQKMLDGDAPSVPR